MVIVWLPLKSIVSYENHQITAVDMHHENLNSCRLATYLPMNSEQIKRQN